MKISLIEPKAPGVHVYAKFKLPRLGLPLLGAMLERELGIRPTIYFQELGNIDWDDVADSDLVGISTITPTAPEAFAILERIKERGDIPVVMGGAHVTFLPDEALQKGADFVIRGEGEYAMLELVKKMVAGDDDFRSIPGLSYRDGAENVHNPNIPRGGEGKTTGKKGSERKQFEAGKRPKDYLDKLKTEKQYEHETGMTPEAQIMYATMYLEKHNRVIDDYDGAGSASYQLGAYFPASGVVPHAYWFRIDSQVSLRWDGPGSAVPDVGFRPAVRVS